MPSMLGCRTDKTSIRIGKAWHITEQDWILHPTKGWKRGRKRKRIKQASGGKCYPATSFTQTWKSWR